MNYIIFGILFGTLSTLLIGYRRNMRESLAIGLSLLFALVTLYCVMYGIQQTIDASVERRQTRYTAYVLIEIALIMLPLSGFLLLGIFVVSDAASWSWRAVFAASIAFIGVIGSLAGTYAFGKGLHRVWLLRKAPKEPTDKKLKIIVFGTALFAIVLTIVALYAAVGASLLPNAPYIWVVLSWFFLWIIALPISIVLWDIYLILRSIGDFSNRMR